MYWVRSTAAFSKFATVNGRFALETLRLAEELSEPA